MMKVGLDEVCTSSDVGNRHWIRNYRASLVLIRGTVQPQPVLLGGHKYAYPAMIGLKVRLIGEASHLNG
jgi:hypothetical protein